MKKMTMIATAALALMSAWADDAAYSLVNDEQGYSYIQINQDLDAFSFYSDFKSIGNSGVVGFYVYPEDLEGQKLKDYINEVGRKDPEFQKKLNDGLVDLGELKKGDRVGFYLARNNGDVIRSWNFETWKDTTYIAFDKNGAGKDEWMSITKVTATAAGSGTGGSGGTPSGQPLPGALAILALGGIGAGVAKLRGRKQAK